MSPSDTPTGSEPENATPAKPDPGKAKPSGVVKNSIIYSGVTLISRFMGLARDLVITAALGASGTIMADAYATALSFPNLFRRIFAEGAFTAAFVPAYSGVLEKDGEAAAQKLARDALATMAAVSILMCVIFQLAMPWLMRFYSAGYLDNPAKFHWAVLLTQITMPYLPCMTIVALLSGVLNAHGKFVISALAPTLMNLFMLIAAVPFINDPQKAGLAICIGVLVSGLGQVALLVWGCYKTGARIGFAMPTLRPEIKALLVLAVPGALAAAATQINIFVSQWLSAEVDGARSWLMVADRLYQLPLGLVGVAIGVALLPALSRAVQAGDHEGAQKSMDDAVVFSMVFTLPAAAAIMAIPFYLIDGLYTRGAFNAFDARQTANALFHYGWGVPAFVLTRILTPAFFARKDTFGPMKFALVSVAINLVVGVAMFRLIGVPGLAVGTSAAAWANVVLMVIALHRRGLWTLGSKALSGLARVVAAGAGMAVFCALCSYFRPSVEGALGFVLPLTHGLKEISIVGVCFAGLFLYIGLLFVTGAARPAELKAMLRRKRA